MSNLGQTGIHSRRRARKRKQLFFRQVASSRASEQKQQRNNDVSFHLSKCYVQIKSLIFFLIMNKSVKIGLIGIVFLAVLLIIILLINLQYSFPETLNTSCLNFDGEETCHSVNQNAYRYYGTKTAYHTVMSNDTEFLYGDCDPQLFYLYSRHATRYPDENDIKKMSIYLPSLRDKILNSSSEGKCNICKNDVEKLKSWRLNLKPEDDNLLSESGKKEAFDLALRFRKRFPTLLDRSYSSDAFMFAYTSRVRSQTTAESFAKGLFGPRRSASIDLSGKAKDDLLQFHIGCKEQMKKCNDTTTIDLKELDKFENGPILTSLVNSISRRLGFEVSMDDVKIMYRACVFGYTLEDDDIWCSVFSTSDLKVMEFDADIDDYYKDAYGNSVNYEQACPVVKNLVDIIKNASDNRNLKAVLYFSHAGAIKKVFSRFGLFKDDTPIIANSICNHQNRRWRSSLICPFNSNLAIVLFQCGREHKIAAFHNENPVIIDGCTDVLCPIENFYTTYSPIAVQCNVKSMCCKCCNV